MKRSLPRSLSILRQSGPVTSEASDVIARLTGVLEEKTPEQLIINVNGVGYQVFVSLQTFYRLPALHESVSLQIYTHLREDALLLYGFLEEKEKAGSVC